MLPVSTLRSGCLPLEPEPSSPKYKGDFETIAGTMASDGSFGTWTDLRFIEKINIDEKTNLLKFNNNYLTNIFGDSLPISIPWQQSAINTCNDMCFIMNSNGLIDDVNCNVNISSFFCKSKFQKFCFFSF